MPLDAIVDADHPDRNRDAVAEVLPNQEILPRRYQPAVTAANCLRQYLLSIYAKQVDTNAAEKFLAKFKKQKPKQTCSNFLDEFIMQYETYSEQRWTVDQLRANLDDRTADILRLVLDGLRSEFTANLDYTQLEVNDLKWLETEVLRWQLETVAAKSFTAGCVVATNVY